MRKVDTNGCFCVCVYFRLNSKIREEERELFKMKDSIQLLQVKLLCTLLVLYCSFVANVQRRGGNSAFCLGLFSDAD